MLSTRLSRAEGTCRLDVSRQPKAYCLAVAVVHILEHVPSLVTPGALIAAGGTRLLD